VQRLPQRHRERELIGARVDRLAGQLLGRHVAERADHRPGLGRDHLAAGRALVVAVARGDGPGQAEVGDPRPAVVADHDVVGLDVAVDHAGRVRRRQAVARRGVQRDDLAPGARPLADPRSRGAAADVLHRQVDPPGVLPDLVHDDDVGMRQLRQRRRLSLDPGQRRRRPRGAQLDRHRALEPQVARQVDHAHAARADRPVEAVLAVDHRARGQRRAGAGRRHLVQQRRHRADVAAQLRGRRRGLDRRLVVV
jgi:hypothetical protein